MKSIFTKALLLILIMWGFELMAQTNTWNGSSSTAWNTPANWSLGHAPLASENVVIPSAPANQPLISGTTTPVCTNLTINSGASLTISGTSVANALLTVSGTATINGHLSIGGSITKTGKIAVGNILWNSGSTINALYNARCEVSGNWTFASGSDINTGLCFVTFNGTANSVIYNYSATSKFSSLTLAKTTTATTSFGTGSVGLTITGGLNINADNTFTCSQNITTILQGNITCNGLINFYQGTVRLERTSAQSLSLSAPGNKFNNLVVACGETVTLNNSLNILGDFTLEYGTFDPQNNTLYVTGDWNNEAGPEYFTEGSGKVVLNVIINKNGKGAYDQHINYSEDFNILEINNAYGEVIINSMATIVTCNQYNWTAGGIKVEAGTFTAMDLADNGIFGKFSLQTGGTINLTNNDGFVDLNGATITITGGDFNVYGGTSDSYWPYGVASSITMSDGTLNFAQTGIRVESAPALTYNITGGTIKTAEDFSSYNSNFDPAGGTVELYGPDDADLYLITGSTLYSVNINKGASFKEAGGGFQEIVRMDRETGKPIDDDGSRAQTVNLTNPATFNGNFTLSAGTFNSNNHTIQVKRNWTNNAGAGSFNPGTGRVIFNGGNYHQYCYNETFNILEVAKASGGSFRVNSGSVTCAQYDWTAGSIDVNTGTFTANDLYENGLFGGFYVNPAGTINLYQDIYQNTDLNGNITFTDGGNINIYGGNGNSQWAQGGNASITMNGGTLDFKDQGITLTVLSPNTITENITGGTIRTSGGFFCNRSDFTPSGGTLEFTGSNNVNLEQYAGSLRNIRINKSNGASVEVGSNLTCVTIDVDEGRINAENKIITLNGHLNVNDAGIYRMAGGAQLKIAAEMSVNVNSGGYFYAIGAMGNECVVTRQTSNYYYFNVNGGATISTRYTRYEYSANIILSPDAIIDPAVPFDYCTFSHGQGTYILFNSNQELTIHGANFPTLPPTNTVAKTINQGRITFRDATGAYSGPGYEYDPYNRIDWTITQPGLWTGAVSTNWYTAGNWDDGQVPNAGTDVVIPVSAPNMPVVGAGDSYINSLTVNGSLNLAGGNLTVYGNSSFTGELLMTSSGSQFIALGDVAWNAGSSAEIDLDVTLVCNGNWNFNAGSAAHFNNGKVIFAGTTTKWIRSYADNSFFHHLYIQKTGGAQTGFSDFSTQPLEIKGEFKIWPLAEFAADAEQDMVLHGNFTSNGTFEGNAGKLVFDGTNQIITPNTGDYFNSLKFSQSGTVSVNTSHTSNIVVNENLQITSGVFAPGNVTIYLSGYWSNPAGPDAFNESNSTVVFNGSSNVQRIYNSENFMTLVMDKPGSGSLIELTSLVDIYCHYYDWNDGTLSVVNGSFTANSLVGGVIGGDVSVQTNGTITMGNLSEQIDLVGRLFILGGTFNIINGIESQWPGDGNAQLTMTGGELNVYPYGIEIVDNYPYVFYNQITGGKIRTTGSFVNHRTDFAPEACTIELYGEGDVFLTMNTTPTIGILHNVSIDKQAVGSKGGSVTLSGNLLLNGGLDVNEGTLNTSTGNMLVVLDHVNVYDGGTLSFEPNTAFGLYAGCTVIIHDGGTFKSLGTYTQPIFVDRWGENGFYDFGVGGTISSRFTSFNHCGNLIVGPTGYIDPDNAFYHCSFPFATGALLTVNNSQNIILREVDFPIIPAIYNVKKTNDSGLVIMKDATGPGAGPDYEYDPYNRINWEESQPGLWTGYVSTDWHTAGNWDDLIVPSSTTDVVIPQTAPGGNMPVIQQDAECKSMVMRGQLSILAEELTVTNMMIIYDQVTITGDLTVLGDIWWQEGSNAVTSESCHITCSGDWLMASGSDINITGNVTLTGAENSILKNYSFYPAQFKSLIIDKTNGAKVILDETSSRPVVINGTMMINEGGGFYSNCPTEFILKGNFFSNGDFECDAGAFKFEGNSQELGMSPDNYFYNLEINPTSYVDIYTGKAISDEIHIHGSLILNSGVLRAGNSTIYVGKNWINNVGNTAFAYQQSKVVFNSESISEFQLLTGNTVFNTLEIQQEPTIKLSIGDEAVVVCMAYDWTSGGIEVGSGSFTAYDLIDNKIAGNWKLYSGATINLTDENAIGLGGNVVINGGIFNVYGGNNFWSFWPHYSNASLTMSDGILNFNTQSIEIRDDLTYTFTSIITGGKIMTTGWFLANNGGFYPSGGTVELHGETNGYAGCDNGAAFYNLTINKTHVYDYVGLENVVVRNALNIDGGRGIINPNETLTSYHSVNVNNGWLNLQENSRIWMGNNGAINIANGSRLNVLGNENEEVIFSAITQGNFYHITVDDGGYISAENAIFDYLDATGVIVLPGAMVDETRAFRNCTFRNGKEVLFPYLTINTNQNLVLDNVEFSGAGRQKNVAKMEDSGSLTFVGFTGNLAGSAFETDPYGRIFWQDEQQIHSIQLPAGWSGLSSYLIPAQPAMEDVFAPVSDEFIIAQTMTEMYFPGQNINTIGDWESHSAFRVKTSEACILPITGSYETNMTVSLNAGWSLLPVVTPTGAPVQDLLLPVSGFVMAKDVAGTGVYWPDYGINTMEYLLPGKAYFVLLSEAGDVNFTGMKSSQNLTGFENLLGLSQTLAEFRIQRTPSTHTIAILPEALKGFEPGTIIGAFDQSGNCFGATVCDSEIISLTVFGDDPTTVEKDGFFEGEVIFFKTLTGFQTLSGLTPTFDQILPQSDGLFTENGLSAITGLKESTGIFGNTFSQKVNIFPNPAQGIVNISGIIPGTKLTVTDLHGKVLMEKIADAETAQFDLTGHQSGIYFIKISQNGTDIFRKIVLK